MEQKVSKYFKFLQKMWYSHKTFLLDGGRPGPCCYDFKWSEITAWEDQMLVASVSMTTPCGGNIEPPLLQDAVKIHFKI